MDQLHKRIKELPGRCTQLVATRGTRTVPKIWCSPNLCEPDRRRLGPRSIDTFCVTVAHRNTERDNNANYLMASLVYRLAQRLEKGVAGLDEHERGLRQQGCLFGQPLPMSTSVWR